MIVALVLAWELTERAKMTNAVLTEVFRKFLRCSLAKSKFSCGDSTTTLSWPLVADCWLLAVLEARMV